jgi:hypothetical protein
MKATISLLAFVLLTVGLAGLLLNEFVFHWGRGATLTFASVEVVGFVMLAFARWGMK